MRGLSWHLAAFTANPADNGCFQQWAGISVCRHQGFPNWPHVPILVSPSLWWPRVWEGSVKLGAIRQGCVPRGFFGPCWGCLKPRVIWALPASSPCRCCVSRWVFVLPALHQCCSLSSSFWQRGCQSLLFWKSPFAGPQPSTFPVRGAAGQPQTLLGDGFPPSWEHVRSCRDILALAKSPWRLLCTLGNSFCRASGCTNCSSQAVSKASFYWEGFSDTWARTSFQVRSLVEAGISLHYEA